MAAGTADIKEALAEKAGNRQNNRTALDERAKNRQGSRINPDKGDREMKVSGQKSQEARQVAEKTAYPGGEGEDHGTPLAHRDGGKNAIRLLQADEIECRTGVVNEKGLSLLLFKDARVDQRILDEIFTPFGWKRTHQNIEGNLYCTVEVWDAEKKQWIAKQDVGVSGRWEKEKAEASDSFKRACFNWGIGRELYSAPFIWVPNGVARIEKKKDAYTTPDHFSVHSISYNGQREITGLVIINNKGQVVFSIGQGPGGAASNPGRMKEQGELQPSPEQVKRQNKKQGETMPGPVQGERQAEGQRRTMPDSDQGERRTGAQRGAMPTPAQMKELEKELARTGVAMEAVLERYHIQGTDQMTKEIYTWALNSLKKTKAKQAA